MLMTMPGTSGGGSSKYPFTASQWQELENQALIFKYMACGYPIPSDLILHIRRSVLMDSTAASLFPLQPTIGGWGCYQPSGGRKVAEDPEPGRCRRTDGKKWRCSKEACQDSKYCERHMHRGKNRSRKPVEMSLNTSSNGSNTGSSNISMAASENQHHHQPSAYPYGPYSSYSIRPPAMSLTSDRDWRYYHGLKAAGMEQYTCISEASEGERDGGSWRFTPLGMSSLGESRRQQQEQNSSRSCSQFGKEEKNQNQNQNQNQDCFVLGTTDLDFKLGRDVEDRRVVEETHPKPIRHFFNDWSLKSGNKETTTWMGYEEDQSSFSKTQLSISIPTASGHHHHHHHHHHHQNLSKDDSTD